MIDWSANSRPIDPAASPIDVPKSGKRPLTAPHGSPIPNPATQHPTTTRSRANAPIMPPRPRTSIRVLTEPLISSGPTIATRASPLATR